MSSAGNRGMISNNAGSPNWNFPKRNSRDAGEKDASTAQRRRVSVVLFATKELSASLTLPRYLLQREVTTYLQ